MGIDEHNDEKHWARSLLGMSSQDLQFTSSHSNLSLPNGKTYIDSFLVLIGMHLDVVVE